MMRILAVAAVFLLMAGCAGPENPDLAPPASTTPSVAVPAVFPVLPCKSELREGAKLTDNLREIGFAPLPGSRSLGNELAATRQENQTLVAMTRTSAGAGVDIYDGSDPLQPLVLSTWRPEASDYVQDAKFVDPWTLVVGGSSTIQLVDVRKPTDPETIHAHKLDGPGAHMVGVFEVDNRTYVAAAKGENRDVSIFEIQGQGSDRTLRRVARPAMTPLGDTDRPDPLRSHDVWFEVDPVLRKPLLWVANVYWGVAALDVSDPSKPVIVATIRNDDPNQNYVHNVQVTHLQGKRIVVATAEYGIPALKAWDATDLKNPRLVATWSSSGQVKGMSTLEHHRYPTKGMHNFQVLGSHVLLAHLDLGVFTFDLSNLSLGGAAQRLEPTGRALPLGDPGPNPRPSMYVGDYFGSRDVIVFDGVVWVSETTMGLRALQFGCLGVGSGTSSRG